MHTNHVGNGQLILLVERRTSPPEVCRDIASTSQSPEVCRDIAVYLRVARTACRHLRRRAIATTGSRAGGTLHACPTSLKARRPRHLSPRRGKVSQRRLPTLASSLAHPAIRYTRRTSHLSCRTILRIGFPASPSTLVAYCCRCWASPWRRLCGGSQCCYRSSRR